MQAATLLPPHVNDRMTTIDLYGEPTWGDKRTLLPDPAVPPYVRMHFVRKVYLLFALQLAVTATSVGLFLYHPSLHTWVTTGRNAMELMYGTSLASIALVCTFACVRSRFPWNGLAFAAFTAVEATSIGAVCGALQDTPLVLVSAAVAGAVFVALSIATWVFGKPPGLSESMLLVTFLSAGVVGLLAHVIGPTWALAGAFLGICAVCGFVVYDTARILDRLGPDDALDGALALYLDALNLFLCMLSCLQSGSEV